MLEFSYFSQSCTPPIAPSVQDRMVDGIGGVQKKILSLSEFGYEAEIEADQYSRYE